mmetsp:Transcript_29063/g.73044  ORF Transcript_29063/g.73044 Transcript_29063/m.73044 type:complete len:426 (+) Transcript_29063:614-1891(+)
MLRIDLLHTGYKHCVHTAGGGEPSTILLHTARIGVEVFVCGELARVHKDAGHHLIALTVRLLDQLKMAVVQGAHGGYEAHTATVRVGSTTKGTHLVHTLQHLERWRCRRRGAVATGTHRCCVLVVRQGAGRSYHRGQHVVDWRSDTVLLCQFGDRAVDLVDLSRTATGECAQHRGTIGRRNTRDAQHLLEQFVVVELLAGLAAGHGSHLVNHRAEQLAQRRLVGERPIPHIQQRRERIDGRVHAELAPAHHGRAALIALHTSGHSGAVELRRQRSCIVHLGGQRQQHGLALGARVDHASRRVQHCRLVGDGHQHALTAHHRSHQVLVPEAVLHGDHHAVVGQQLWQVAQRCLRTLAAGQQQDRLVTCGRWRERERERALCRSSHTANLRSSIGRGRSRGRSHGRCGCNQLHRGDRVDTLGPHQCV